MLTIGKLTPGRAAYYCEQLPGGRDEYYTNGREQPGRWLGSAAGRLGLDGRVEPEQFRAVLDGRHPGSGAPLGLPATTSRRVAGYDLCLSAPKSVSVAWALAPPEMAERIAAAHDNAVTAVVSALEAEAVRARRGAGGRIRVATGGVAAAAFGHRTSRAGDPQIHTHLVVANLTPDTDGRWTAIDGATIYRWAKTLGYLYQAEFRAELTAGLGFEWGPVRNGAADLTGIDPAAIEAFSKRSAQISAALGGTASGVPLPVAKTATLATRAAKADLPDLATLRQRWAGEAAALDLHPATVESLAHRTGPRPPDVDRLYEQLLSPEGLTSHASTFDRRDILRQLAAAHPSGRTISELRADADRFAAHPEVVALDPGPAGPRYTTGELLEIEARLIDRAARRSSAGVGQIPSGQLVRTLDERPGLSTEQKAMVTSLVTSGAGVEVVIGRAGAGKTYALDAARAGWQAADYHVIGAALAARAAAELQSGAGIPSTTIDRLLTDLDRPGPLSVLPPGTCVVVDEAGMVGSRKLARLLDHAERARAKVVLVGDHRQLPEIEAGGCLAALRHVVPSTELVDNRRQVHQWERAALAELRSGRVPVALTAYSEAGRLHMAPTVDDVRRAMVDDWWEARQSGQEAAMYALRRSDVADLNQRARTRLDHAGQLGGERLEVSSREFAVGDQVMCRRNDRRLGVRNGTAATITAIDTTRRTVTLSDGTVLPADYLDAGHLDHGYAVTIHKAQGATVDRALLLGSAGLYREAGYVGLSRARHRSDLYIVAGPPGHERRESDPLADTIRQLATSRAQTLAINQLPNREEQLPPVGKVSGREGEALAADPPAWLVEVLGPPPLAGSERDRWTRDACRIAAYRDTHHITDPTDALGARPADPEQRRAWDLARLTVTEHHRRIEREQGLYL